MHAFDWSDARLPWRARLHALGYHLFRGPDTVAGCLRSQLIVANTPETEEILLYYPQGSKRRKIQGRILQLPLGFSPSFFCFAPQRLAPARAEFALSEEALLFMYSSRFASNKERAIELSIQALQGAMEQDPRIQALLIGFDGGEISRRFQEMIQQGPSPQRFHMAPFAPRERLSQLYHAADVALFVRPSISCQESMGTGLYALLADDGSMDHLLSHPSQGALFPRDEVPQMIEAILSATALLGAQDDPLKSRAERAQYARRLGYDRICQEVLKRLGLG